VQEKKDAAKRFVELAADLQAHRDRNLPAHKRAMVKEKAPQTGTWGLGEAGRVLRQQLAAKQAELDKLIAAARRLGLNLADEVRLLAWARIMQCSHVEVQRAHNWKYGGSPIAEYVAMPAAFTVSSCVQGPCCTLPPYD